MFRLAHLSDIHLGPLPGVTYRQLASKRITGYINWHRNRRRNLHEGVTERLLSDMAGFDPDHVAITGDLVNLALDAELEMAQLWLESLGPAAGVSVVPGNHDAYVPGALSRACRAWEKWMHADLTPATTTRHGFPYLQRRGPLAIIGASSAVATAPFMASGSFSSEQAKGLSELLEKAGAENLFRVIMIHHPPVRGATATRKRLYGIRRFQKVLRKAGAELVIHGHTHLATTHWITGKDGRIPVVGVAAAGQGPGSSKPAAQYNLFDIDGKPGAWRLTLQRRGLKGEAIDPVKIASEELM
ncbi:MAG: metallophosphoesterase [Rhizobiaceae bacterium]|nr:metallophosphoesterase [Maricaulis sp.]MBO6901130.1 metallophosphoesterase [Rhizobiaceae bacterium]